jgi:hypothetical protein
MPPVSATAPLDAIENQVRAHWQEKYGKRSEVFALMSHFWETVPAHRRRRVENNMEQRKQTKAKNAEMVRTETLTFRLDKRLRSLAEIAARSKGIKLANCVEGALEASLTEPMEFLRGASIAAKADSMTTMMPLAF